MDDPFFWLVIELAANLFEAIILFAVFDTFFERKYTGKWQYTLFPLVHMAAITAVNTFNPGMLPSSLTLMLISGLYVRFLYQSKWRNSILSIILYHVVWFLTELSVVLILGIMFTISMDDVFEQNLYRLIGIVVSKTIQLIILKAIQHLRLKSSLGLKPRTWISLMSFPLATIFTSFAWYSLGRTIRSETTVIFFSISVMIMLFANLMVFFLFESNIRQMTKQHTMELVQLHTANEIERLHQLQDNQHRLRQLSHDLLNKLVPLNVLIRDDQKREALEYLQSLQGSIQQVRGPVDSGNPVIDVLLNQKSQQAELSGIKITCKVADCSSLDFQSEDLCVILGNALDNAIEACSKIPEAADRQINCELIRHAKSFMIKITNPVEGTLVKDGNTFRTTKKDKISHGIGLKSIRQIVDQNQGYLTLDSNGQSFEFCVILPV